MGRFAGSRVVVTGAAHGIGLATARAFLAEGAVVCAVDSSAERLLEALGQESGVDLVDAEVGQETEELVAAVLSGGQVDVLVNNVGTRAGRGFMELERAQLRRTYLANVEGPWFLTKGLAEEWRRRKARGSVVFMLSLHTATIRMNPDYSTSKAGLEMLIKELAVELAPLGIRVNGISPGAIDTWSSISAAAAEHAERSRQAIPLGRMGTPEDVAHWVLALSHEQTAGYMTGSVVTIDGGLRLHNWLLDLYTDAAHERRVTDF
ncbi:glucose 1-dehydrogenase [Streptacidiphilus sp. EB129]